MLSAVLITIATAQSEPSCVVSSSGAYIGKSVDQHSCRAVVSPSTVTGKVASLFGIECFCSNEQFVNTLSCCLQAPCDPSEIVAFIATIQATCKTANVTDVAFPPCVSENGTFTAIPYSSSSSATSTMTPSTIGTSSLVISTAAALLT